MADQHDVREIFDSLFTLIPEAELNGFSSTIDSSGYNPFASDARSCQLKVKFTLNGKTYSKGLSMPCDNLYDGGDAQSRFPLIPEQVADFCNQFLREEGSPDRIVHIYLDNAVAEFKYSHPIWWARMNYEQADAAFPYDNSAWFIQRHAFSHEYQAAAIDTGVGILEDAGLLAHLPPGKIKDLRREGFLHGLDRISQLFDLVPNLISCFPNDVSLATPIPWPGMIEQFVTISHGAFDPAGMTIKQEPADMPKGQVTFRFQGKGYEWSPSGTPRTNSHQSLAALFNQAMSDAGKKGRFREFGHSPEGICYIFTTNEQFQTLIEYGFIRDPASYR